MAPVQLRAATESWEGEARKEPNLLHTLSSAVVPHWGERHFGLVSATVSLGE